MESGENFVQSWGGWGTETQNKCRIPSEEDSGVNKSKYNTVSYKLRVRAGAPPSCHRKEVRLASAIELTKYRIVNSIPSKNHINHALRLAIAMHTEKSWTHLRERNPFGKERTQLTVLFTMKLVHVSF